MNALEAEIERARKEYHRLLEQACEMAIQSGTKGVRVVRDLESGAYSFEVTDEVPYGMIHDYPNGRVP